MPLVISSRRFYSTCKELMDISVKNNCQMSDTVIEFEAECSGRSAGAVMDEMRQMYAAMRRSIAKGNEKESEVLGNMFKGNAKRMDSLIRAGRSICGTTLSEVTRNALAVMEVNGSMGCIVACPTAGSCGTMPAAVITLAERNLVPEDTAVKALFTGAGIGIVVAQNASISGAVGGCQAECGTASALSAAALTEMFGGSCSMVLSSVALALGNLMGLICDPVAGMVEIPCIQRNVMAAANAVVSAEMALAGVDSVVPVDEVIGAMDEVGRLMSVPEALGAGMSNTPTARRLQRQINEDRNALTTTGTLSGSEGGV
jgi:L-serine dehydratase